MTETESVDSGWRRKWPAPAKLNLMLRIVGRREDGYHLLQTVFQILDLCDWLTFHPVNDGSVSLARPTPGVLERDDLTVRAALLLKEYTGSEQGVRIEIEKNLPMGGGLGGGSSDAATTLVVLNRLWRLGLSKDELMQLGLGLGADVPVFVFGCSAWGEGVGEQLQQIVVPEKWVVIIKPDCHVNTKEIFCTEELTRDSKAITMPDFIAGDKTNDCTAVVRNKYKQVADALYALGLYGDARLTGTGACVFAEFDSFESAKNAFDQLERDWKLYLAKGSMRSPLYVQLEQG